MLALADGQPGLAVERLDRTLARAGAAREPLWTGVCLCPLGEVARAHDEYERAVAMYTDRIAG